MPYFIKQGCEGKPDYWGVYAVDTDTTYGCHATKGAAIDQAVAISIADDEPFIGERDLNGPDVKVSDIDGVLISGGNRVERVWDFLDNIAGRLIIVTGRPVSMRDETIAELAQADIEYSRLIMNPGSMADSPEYKKVTMERLLETLNVVVAVDENPDVLSAYRDLGVDAFAPEDLPDVINDDEDSDDEIRQVDLTPPAYMRASARRGLEWHREGLSGDGLVERTVREAVAMAEGNVTADKWVRIRAWIARHLVDLDAPGADPDSDEYPTPGVVAMALWGGGGTKRSAERALAYAEGVVARLEAENEGRAKGEALSKLETRVFDLPLELREEGDGMRLEGYAAIFNSRSENLGGFTEMIEPGAFRASLRSRNDIKFLWNHDSGSVLGSTRAKTLELIEDERGLKVSALLPNTTLGRDVRELVSRGDVTGFSFGFSMPARGGDSWSQDGTERTLKAVRLHEVSLVSFPAYPATNGTATVRGLDKVAQRANVDADALADALLKLESGTDLTSDDRAIVEAVLNELAPTPVMEETVEDSTAQDILALKKAKLKLMMNGW